MLDLNLIPFSKPFVYTIYKFVKLQGILAQSYIAKKMYKIQCNSGCPAIHPDTMQSSPPCLAVATYLECGCVRDSQLAS